MAGLDEVLRSFALQKMQELKEEQRDEGTEDTKRALLDEYNGRQQSSDGQSDSNGRDKHDSATYSVKAETGNHTKQKMTTNSLEFVKSETSEKMRKESKQIQSEPSSSKDGKDKKITIKLLTKKIEPEAVMQRDVLKEKAAKAEMEDEDSSSDSSDDSEERIGKPWRKVYEEGELSPSSEGDEEVEGEKDEEGEKEDVAEEDGMDSDTSGEIKDEDDKKPKKRKKVKKHKKHKHSKDKIKESPPKEKDKHKDKSKKDKKKDMEKDKERKEHKSKDKEKESDKEKSKDRKKSKDKASKDDKVDKLKEENDSGKDKHKEKSDKKEAKEKKHKSKHKDKGSDSKEEKTKGSSKRKLRSGSKSRSQSPSGSKSTSHHKKRKHSKSRSRSPKSHKHGQSTRGYHRTTSPDRYHTGGYGAGARYRHRSRSRSPHSDDEFKIDKVKLLEIAKANAYAKMKSGEFPPYMKLTPKSVVTKVDPNERRSVEELTAVCKEISSKQQDYSDSDDSPVNKPVGSDDESDEPFIRHPFKVREAPLGHVGIVMNIKNAVQKPIQDKEMLRLTFPVSSGSQHRKKEDELGPKPYGDWVSVEKKPNMMDPAAKPTTKIIPTPGTVTLTPAEVALAAAAAAAATDVSGVPAAATAPSATVPPVTDQAAVAAALAAVAMPPPPVPPPTTVAPAPDAPTPTPPPPPAPLTFAGLISPAGALPTTSAIAAASAIPAAVAAAEYASVAAAAAVSKAMAAVTTTPPAPIRVAALPPVARKEEAKNDKVFEEIPNQKVDIAAMVSARLKAARRLEHNPNDVEALSVMHKAQTQIRNWTMGKQKPGMFTGDTGLRTLRPEELANTDPRAQAWAKKHMFHNQMPLTGGNKGAMLMAKMGWRQGEGLGKNNEGTLVPLALDVKTDRKGLVAEDEQRRKKAAVPKAIFKDLSGKHPVSALMEICNKRKWAPPSFDLVHDKGPAHKKNFIFKVRINNEEYQPAISCSNKKQAKAQAAAVALQKMGLIPPDHSV